MAKIFYDHLIVIEEITAVLDTHKLSLQERYELLSYIDQTLHHHVLDVILSLLPKEHHQTFLTRFREHPGDLELLTFLREKSDVDIEKAILAKANEVKKDLIVAINKSEKKVEP